MKPHLACDYDPDKLVFPGIHMPKIDGVRAWNPEGTLLGRSMKQHKNRHVTRLFSMPDFVGFDGEMAAERDTHPALCRLTSSALSTIDGEPWVQWHLFDYLTMSTVGMGYEQRYEALRLRLTYLHQHDAVARLHMRVVPMRICHSLAQFNENHEMWVEAGYEGSIYRARSGVHKNGRCTVREGAYLRRKDFVDEEAVIVSVVEGQRNDNEATINELGRTERSTHQENMVPKGQIGSFVCRKVGEDRLFSVGPGEMKHAERTRLWNLRERLPGRIITFKHFPHGVKDKPRMGTFKCFRDDSDMST